MKKVMLAASFFMAAPLLLLFCVIYLFVLSFPQKPSGKLSLAPNSSVAYADLPAVEIPTSGNLPKQDTRVEIVRQFFQKYNSPLEPYAQNVIDAADKYGLDYRLIPAISMQESDACLKAPVGTNNCWGFGIYGGKRTSFPDYAVAIDTVTKTLATKYKGSGLVTPEEIMTMYTPSSNGSWAIAVNQFMSELQ